MTATPPLLALLEGRKPRPRRAPVIRPKEIALHMSIAAVLREHALPTWQWTHIAAGEHRDIRTAAKLKQMGVRRGWPDFLLLAPNGRAHCLELKREGAAISEDQEAFWRHCVRHAILYRIARTFDEALAVLDAWGVPRIRIGGAP